MTAGSDAYSSWIEGEGRRRWSQGTWGRLGPSSNKAASECSLVPECTAKSCGEATNCHLVEAYDRLLRAKEGQQLSCCPCWQEKCRLREHQSTSWVSEHPPLLSLSAPAVPFMGLLVTSLLPVIDLIFNFLFLRCFVFFFLLLSFHVFFP